MQITKYYSPNFSEKTRSNKSITMIIIHYTGMQSERESIKRLSNPKSKVSCHYIINRKGKTTKKLGIIGKEKALACEVIASISKYE